MNNKHLAVLLLILCILGSLVTAQKLNARLAAAEEARETAEFSLNQERNNYSHRKIQIETLKQDTQALRDYLAAWDPKLRETDDESKARNLFARILRQAGGLIIKKNGGKLADEVGGAFITKRFQSVVSMEGEYIPAMTFLAQLEKQMPASRISSYAISKGTRKDDVKFNFTLDTPVLNQPKPDAGAAKPAGF